MTMDAMGKGPETGQRVDPATGQSMVHEHDLAPPDRPDREGRWWNPGSTGGWWFFFGASNILRDLETLSKTTPPPPPKKKTGKTGKSGRHLQFGILKMKYGKLNWWIFNDIYCNRLLRASPILRHGQMFIILYSGWQALWAVLIYYDICPIWTCLVVFCMMGESTTYIMI